MSEQASKKIDDVLRKETDRSAELDYAEQNAWLLFLKHLDGLEQDRADVAKKGGKKHTYILEKSYRWKTWAAPKNKDGKNAALTGDDLRDFVNQKLFPYLQGFTLKASGPNTIEHKIGQVFGEIKNKISSGYNLREIIDHIDEHRLHALQKVVSSEVISKGGLLANRLSRVTVMECLDYCYDKAVNGMPGLDSAEGLAQSYLAKKGGVKVNAERLVKWQAAKAGTSGFITGLGGFVTLPIAIPANISSVVYIQTRMIAAIAHMGKHDIRDDKVKSLVYMCLCGSAMTDIAKDAGIQIGGKLTNSAIRRISGATITSINQAVGFQLLTKFGQTGAVNLGKAAPLLGGVIGGTVDSLATQTIGNYAIKTFIPGWSARAKE